MFGRQTVIHARLINGIDPAQTRGTHDLSDNKRSHVMRIGNPAEIRDGLQKDASRINRGHVPGNAKITNTG
jgi:hypothetical protein